MRTTTTLFAALLLAPLAALPAADSPTQSGRPNVLFFVSDDLRPELGCYGTPIIQSPNIDRLAKRGMVFERAYCQQAVCSPSRSSVLTGTRPDTTKVWDLNTHFRKALPDVVTLPQLFKDNGYVSLGKGKIFHSGFDDPPSWSAPVVGQTLPDADAASAKKPASSKKKTAAKAPASEPKSKPAGNLTKTERGAAFRASDDGPNEGGEGILADEAIAALRQFKAGSQPFFLAVGFHKPHLPFVAPKAYWDLYDPAKIPLAPNPSLPEGAPVYALADKNELWSYSGVPDVSHLPDDYARQLKHGYYAAVSYMDAQLGRVLDELDRLGLAENTIVVLWGDHGWKLGEHDRWCKHSNVEKDAQAPLIISAPGMKAAGKKTAALTEFVDIYPTIAELAGLPLPSHLEGTSLKPLLDDPDRPWKSAAFSQYPRTVSGKKLMGYSMRTNRYRFTRWVDRDDHSKVDAVELYDHQTDPQENINIAADPANKALVEELTTQWQAGLKKRRKPPLNEMKTLPILLVFALLAGTGSAAEKSKSKSEFPTDVRIEREVTYLPEGRKEKADLYFPIDSPTGARLPAVVWIHGGGWNGGQRDAKREFNVCGTLARNGYVAMSIDYKLAYGKTAVWPTNLGDCKTAVRWLRQNAERLGIDPDRIGVMGGSAGGHLASMVALTTPEDGLDPAEPYGDVSCAVSCCVDMYGITDVTRYHDVKMLGKTIAEAPELYRSASPLTYVRKDSLPFLILHGTADTTVNIEQSKWLDEALTKAGVEHELVIVPDAPHSFDLEPKQRDLRPVVLGFLDKHLKKVKPATAASPEPAASRESKPNIVLFISDQHFADAMGCAGDSFVKTPALDSLAATGVRFRNTYCTYPVCMASRASLMTGLWPHELGATDDEGPSDKGKKSGKATRLEAATSMATLMRQAGYETAYFGKWHVGSSSAKPENAWHGFDVIDDGRVDETTADQAIEFIQRKHDKPFFLVVSFLNPHDICEWARLRSGIHNKMLNGEIAIEPPVEICPALPANFAISADEPEVVTLRRKSQPTRAHPTGEWGETQWRQYRWAYAKLIEKMDQQLGRVVSTLDAAGQRDSTLIAYTSDHGDGNGAHHWNQKMVLYEEATRVPLILSWPGHTPAGKVETRLTSMGLDLLPTFCDYTGIQTPSELAGHSLKPWADQTLTPPPPPGIVVTEVQYSGLLPDGNLVHGLLLRSADFAYINYSAGKNPEQLFDMPHDSGQITNLARSADHQDVLAEHRKLMREWVVQTKSPFPLNKIP